MKIRSENGLLPTKEETARMKAKRQEEREEWKALHADMPWYEKLVKGTIGIVGYVVIVLIAFAAFTQLLNHL